AWRGPSTGPEPSSARIVAGKLAQRRRLTAHESAFLKAHAPGPFKITIPSPSVFMTQSFKPGVTDQFYPSREDLTRDLVAIVRKEVSALVEEGVPYIQLDSPQYYGAHMDTRLHEDMRRRRVDPDQALDEAVAADNACIEGLAREGVTFGIHI